MLHLSSPPACFLLTSLYTKPGMASRFPSSISQKNRPFLFNTFFAAYFCTLREAHVSTHSTCPFILPHICLALPPMLLFFLPHPSFVLPLFHTFSDPLFHTICEEFLPVSPFFLFPSSSSSHTLNILLPLIFHLNSCLIYFADLQIRCAFLLQYVV
ncbi:hypothetical protein Krac_3917 [Ktedonobacter racemifer DSM 44963]|uniref:Uncharacterized protein n=1 Tax=Ktedonobacter racemifer DSM 44963 TaxID=485913 RepID=D6U3L6_KTERA|nr:hypothetical protein Krac_3917 [Ktedonobacter racemifer DSM 44963]